MKYSYTTCDLFFLLLKIPVMTEQTYIEEFDDYDYDTAEVVFHVPESVSDNDLFFEPILKKLLITRRFFCSHFGRLFYYPRDERKCVEDIRIEEQVLIHVHSKLTLLRTGHGPIIQEYANALNAMYTTRNKVYEAVIIRL